MPAWRRWGRGAAPGILLPPLAFPAALHRVLLPAFAAFALAACSPGGEPAAPGLALSSCRLPGLESPALCARHEVWEDRAAARGRRIALRVAVVPAKLRAKERDPVVILAGGPGQGAVALAAQVMPLFAKLNDTRDIVFVDQRGTGESHALRCDEEQGADVQALVEDALPLALVAKCLESLDADPRLYTTAIATADLEDVREALGYPALNLWGGSYGTRAALDYLRRHPQRVRSAVLDGAAPADMKLPFSFVADGDAALERLLAACEKEAPCARHFPRLRESIRRVRAELARKPVRARVADPLTGEAEAVTVTENVFLSGLFRPLYVPELASLLPLGIEAAARGDFSPLLAQNLEFADEIAENLALGMHLSVVCAEDVPRITPAELAGLAGSFFGRSLVDDFMNACGLWPRGEVPADFFEPVRSEAPVLILSGGLDPATPPRHGEAVAATLANARHLVAPNLGHGVSLHGCAPKLIDAFVRKASAAGLDAGCLERIPRPLFVLPLGVKP